MQDEIIKYFACALDNDPFFSIASIHPSSTFEIIRIKMADIVIGVRAYAKMLLHAMKYPHHAVNGVFLAERKRNKEHNTGPVNIVDCVPLFHLSLSLTPMLEVAMMQV